MYFTWDTVNIIPAVMINGETATTVVSIFPDILYKYTTSLFWMSGHHSTLEVSHLT